MSNARNQASPDAPRMKTTQRPLPDQGAVECGRRRRRRSCRVNEHTSDGAVDVVASSCRGTARLVRGLIAGELLEAGHPARRLRRRDLRLLHGRGVRRAAGGGRRHAHADGREVRAAPRQQLMLKLVHNSCRTPRRHPVRQPRGRVWNPLIPFALEPLRQRGDPKVTRRSSLGAL